MNLRHHTIKGVAWNTLGRISNQVLQFGLSVILMRLLQPADYGLLAMAWVVIGFAGIFNEFGFGSAIVQRQDIDAQHLSSVFWINIAIGAGFTLLFFMTAGWMANFFHTAGLKPVMQWLSFSFLIGGLGIVPGALLQKQMRFDLINQISVATTFLSGCIGVYMAYRGYGVMSLVAQSLSNSLIGLPLMFIASRWKPRLVLSWKHVRQLFSFSAYLTGFNVINYWARRSDDLLIGKFMGSTSLGIYSRAYALMLLPITQVISMVSGVMFPALSSIQHDKQRIKSIYIRVIQVIAFFSFPMMLGLVATADHFMLGIFGPKWAGVIPLIRILAFVGVLQCIGNPTGWIYLSQGKTNWMFWWGVFGSGSVVVAIIVGVWMGSIYTVAWAYLFINILLSYPVVAIPGRLIGMKWIEVYRPLLPTFLISASMAIIVYFAGMALPAAWPAIWKLVIQVMLGAGIYFTLMWWWNIPVFHMVRALVAEYRPVIMKKLMIQRV
ncbi:MAG: MOP flippase family protein [Thermoflavifilum sp.]|uniref:MOP flippase family protein n=1 Tax=Thermoflavifilum sp. TaxID=1968839 RepID=UPI0018A47313|nr:MOP flippase family protein [Thermoflavifilum sp.]QOR76695.1 MAG: MOP flippase family protein [Thermoflavifilum sp.]